MEDKMKEVVLKAETLIEALPYIRDFNGKKVVVKYGGSAMLDEKLQESVIKDVALLKLVGMQPIIVHGGGKEISKWLGYMGKESEFVEGLRVTDADTIEVAEMVLNKVNKHLVQMMEKLGVKAAGISGKDGGTMLCEKKTAGGRDIGFVGKVKSVNSDLIDTLIAKDFIPIIAPIGMDENYQAYNINADDAASAVAKCIHAEKLAFMTDIEGVCKDPKDPETLISVLTTDEAKQLIEDGNVSSITPDLSGDLEKLARLKESLTRIVQGRDVENVSLGDFIFDASKAGRIKDYEESLKLEMQEISKHILNKKIDSNKLSSGTKAGVKIALLVASLKEGKHGFYYCDEKFPYIHSDIEKAILSLMIDCLKPNDQLFFTTHNTDILDMNLPKHTYSFLRKDVDNVACPITCIDASSVLKRNTDSLKNAVENDMFSSAPALELIYDIADF